MNNKNLYFVLIQCPLYGNVVVPILGLYELSLLGIWNVYSDPGVMEPPAFEQWLEPRLRSLLGIVSGPSRRKVCRP